MKIHLNNPLMYVYVNPNKYFFTIQLFFFSAYKKPCFAKASRGFAPGPHWGCLQHAPKPPSCSGGASEMLNHPLRE